MDIGNGQWILYWKYREKCDGMAEIVKREWPF